MDKILSALVPDASIAARKAIAETLKRFGQRTLSYVAEHGVTIRPLTRGQRYGDASPALRRLAIDVDTWPAPPAGLFVVEERTVYLRSRSAMTVAHEFGHALDCALGGGVYRSGVDPRIRSAFASATAFVTPYAATGLDEYFAECVRAYVGVNDQASFWPRATRERLAKLDSAMLEIIASIFAALDGTSHADFIQGAFGQSSTIPATAAAVTNQCCR